MKNLLTATIIMFVFLNTVAQDIIVKNDKTEVKAKIEELTETTIKYKKFEMLDGPSYNINKRDVFMIIYKNGTKEYIESNSSTTVQAPISNNTINSNSTALQNNPTKNISQTNPLVGHTAMKKIRRGYYEFEGNKLKAHSDYIYTFEKYDYKDLAARYKGGRNIGFVSSGLGLLGLGVGIAINNNNLIIVGGVVSLVGSILATNQRNNAIKEFNKRATIKVGFNSNVQISPMFSASQNSNKVGVNIRF